MHNYNQPTPIDRSIQSWWYSNFISEFNNSYIASMFFFPQFKFLDWCILTHPIQHAIVLTSSIMPLNLYRAYRHIRLNMCPCWPRLSCHPHISNPSSWRCNKILISGFPWQCSLCMLVQVYWHVHKSSNSQAINFHQAYIIILTQHFNNFTIRLKVTRQWPFTAYDPIPRCHIKI